MNLFLVFNICFIILIFIVLPVGIEIPKEIKKGNASSAPEKPYIGLKLTIAVITSLLITLIYWLTVYK